MTPAIWLTIFVTVATFFIGFATPADSIEQRLSLGLGYTLVLPSTWIAGLVGMIYVFITYPLWVCLISLTIILLWGKS